MEKRISERYHISTMASLEVEGKKLDGFIKNLSHGGALFMSYHKLEERGLASLNLKSNGNFEHKLNSKIVRLKSRKKRSRTIYEYGLEFKEELSKVKILLEDLSSLTVNIGLH